VRTTAGSLILKDWVPTRSAPVVRALEAAGMVMAGKTNTHEFAFGTTNDNPHYGATRNPWNPALTTGGSSGGSAAAVASGEVPIALGTDTAGSVRIPAALCGCVGFKPGWGVLSTRGVIPLAPSLDTVGFLTDTVANAALAFFRRTTHDARPRTLAGLTVGVIDRHAFDRVEDEIVAAVEAALRLLESRGARIRRIATNPFADCVGIGVPLVRWEALRYHRQWFPARRADYGADVARSLDAALELKRGDYTRALAARRRLERASRALLADVDLLAGPTVPVTAFPNRVAYEPVAPGGELPRFALTRLTYPFSLSRLPAITVPCGLSSRNLPIALQLAAGSGKEALLLAAAAAYEAARGPWPKPPRY
jgi:aspartyl-tRNA(Asn)/glutamyl-tRNA(Gln) amidotransferase subunit A